MRVSCTARCATSSASTFTAPARYCVSTRSSVRRASDSACAWVRSAWASLSSACSVLATFRNACSTVWRYCACACSSAACAACWRARSAPALKIGWSTAAPSDHADAGAVNSLAASMLCAPCGHAIECRINAEHPYKFPPSPGRITSYHAPGGPGIRVDSHVYNNYFVPPHYDSMIGKIIAYGDTREQAMARMRTALSEMWVEGIDTNLALHRELLQDAAFMRGATSIHYLEERLAERTKG